MIVVLTMRMIFIIFTIFLADIVIRFTKEIHMCIIRGIGKTNRKDIISVQVESVKLNAVIMKAIMHSFYRAVNLRGRSPFIYRTKVILNN